MVGQHDEPVRARREPARPVQPADLLVDRPDHGQRVVPLDAGVVGYLVVAEEVRVHHRPRRQHVADDRRHHQVSGDHRGGRPRERVEAAALHPRPHVGAALAGRRGHLAQDVDDGRADRPHEVHRVGEVGVVPVGVAGPAPGGGEQRDGAHREAGVVGVAGEQAAARGATTSEQAAAVGVPPLDLRGVGRVRARHDVVAVLLVPAEPEDVLVGPVQQPAHARTGLRAPVAVPVGQHVAALGQPGRERGQVAVADGPAHGVVAEPVDLQQQHTRRQLLAAVLGPAEPAGGAAEEQLVLVDRQQAADQRAHRRHRDHHEHRRAQVRDHHTGHHERQREQPRAEQQQRADAEREDRHGQRDPQHQRPHHGAQHAVEQGEHRRLPPQRQGEVGQPHVEHVQLDGHQHPHQQQPGDQSSAAQQPSGAGVLHRCHGASFSTEALARPRSRYRATSAVSAVTTRTRTVAMSVATTGWSNRPPLTTPSAE